MQSYRDYGRQINRASHIVRVVRDNHPNPVSLSTLAYVLNWPRDGALRTETRRLVADGVLVQRLGPNGGYRFTDEGMRRFMPTSS